MSGGLDWFKLTHSEGVTAQTLYAENWISFEYGPELPWDLNEAVLTAHFVTPEPASLLLLAATPDPERNLQHRRNSQLGFKNTAAAAALRLRSTGTGTMQRENRLGHAYF